MNSISRRKFLKISGATVVTAAALANSAKTIVGNAKRVINNNENIFFLNISELNSM